MDTNANEDTDLHLFNQTMEETQAFSNTMKGHINSINEVKTKVNALTETFEIQNISELFEQLFSHYKIISMA